MWFIGVEVERETSAPLLKNILDPPLMFRISVHDFFPNLSHAYNLVRVIEGKIVQK